MRIQLKMTQQLVMTPQLVQAIRLLQLSRLELVEEIRKELDGNPLLGDDGGADATSSRENVTGTREIPATDNDRAERIPEHSDTDLAARDTEKRVKEVDWEQFLENRQMQQMPPGQRSGFEELPPIEQSLSRSTSLREHLLFQLQMSDFVDNERVFAELVIGNLDERGYLDLSGGENPDGTKRPDLTLEDLANEAGLHPEDAPEVLALIQRFDPIGVAARDLGECLRVQAEVIGYDQIELAIIKDHLHNVERRNFGAIAKALKITNEEVCDAVQEIQKLESVPARNFAEVDDKTIAIT
ncbi:MAG TPA: RNA polymerase sigma-54 factor, partial [Polyangium sp.]|nr:RNA polymerase sigma-54 factor [Polyangium sp.]